QPEPDRLLAFQPIRLLERRKIEPAELGRDLRCDPAGGGDRALDREDVGAGDLSLRHRRRRRSARHDDDARQAAPRRIDRRGAAGVARRGDDEASGAERSRARDRHAQAARLERAGRVLAFVLRPELLDPEVSGEPRELEQRRPPLAERHRQLGVVERRQLAEPVHAGCTLAERVLRHARRDTREVVTHREHLPALLADGQETLGIVAGAADGALDVAYEAHGGRVYPGPNGSALPRPSNLAQSCAWTWDVAPARR